MELAYDSKTHTYAFASGDEIVPVDDTPTFATKAEALLAAAHDGLTVNAWGDVYRAA